MKTHEQILLFLIDIMKKAAFSIVHWQMWK